MSIQINTYRCGSCDTEHDAAIQAIECCNAEFVVYPISDLPPDAVVGVSEQFNITKDTFIGGWQMVQNHTPSGEPVRVFLMPQILANAFETIIKNTTDIALAGTKQRLDKIISQFNPLNEQSPLPR